MLTVDHFARIRRAHRDEMSIRAIAKQFHHSRRKVREALGMAEPKPYQRTKEPAAPKLGPFTGHIDAMLLADEQAPRKQRHTAMHIFRRLVQEHGYPGSYSPVRRYVQKKCRRQRETFIPLDHDPGQRAEADFGHIYVDFPEGRRQVAVLLVTWAYSYCPFAIALPTERTEAILHGLVEAFAFFGCVPRELWWDNPTTVAVTILAGRQRQLHERYQALASHYNFEPLFCMPRRGNEKPHVENRVKDLERRWATPVPTCQDLAALNAHLRQCCLDDHQRCATGQTETIGQRFGQDCDQALSLPAHAFDACIAQAAKVDKYQTVAFDNNRYSVPRRYAFQAVTVKGYVHEVVVVADGQVVARHPRCYQSGQQILDPLHYLSTLKTKPACLDHANVYRHWQLPAIFYELRQALEKQHGPRAGSRHFIRVLLLLEHHPPEHVQKAIERSRQGDGFCLETILHRTCAAATPAVPGSASVATPLPPTLAEVQVPRPDLRRFDQLLSCGELHNVPDAVVENQPETAALAGHERRV